LVCPPARALSQPGDCHAPAAGPGVRFVWLALAGLCAGPGFAVLAACGPQAIAPAVAAEADAQISKEAFDPDHPMPQAQSNFEYGGELTQGGWIRGVVPSGTVEAALDAAPLPLAPDGSFFAAFDRDAASSAKLSAKRADGSTILRELTIAPRAWAIERVNI